MEALRLGLTRTGFMPVFGGKVFGTVEGSYWDRCIRAAANKKGQIEPAWNVMCGTLLAECVCWLT